MSKQIEIRVGGVSYKVATDSEQEARLREVADLWGNYVDRMQKAAPRMGRDNMLVLAGLMMADDLYNEKSESLDEDDAMTAFHNRLADRVEALCTKLEA